MFDIVFLFLIVALSRKIGAQNTLKLEAQIS